MINKPFFHKKDERNVYVMKLLKEKSLKVLSVCMCLSLMLSLGACGKDKAKKDNASDKKDEPLSTTYSGVLKPVSETKVIPNGKGEIKVSNYEVGDIVNEGDLLYQLDDNGLADTIAITQNSISKQKITIATAQENVNNLKIYAAATGVLHDFNIKNGERVNTGTVGKIYDEQKVLAVVPFNETQVASIAVGDSATVVGADLMSSVSGRVSRIYDAKRQSTVGAVLYNVEIEITNPGGIYSGMSVNATVKNARGSFSSPESGTVNNADYTAVVAKSSGNAIKVNVKEGQKVTKGQLIAELESTNLTSTLSRAKLDLKDLNIRLKNYQKDYADTFVYAPVSGEITEKNKNVNDNITSSSQSIMTIADTSSFTVVLYVDDEDIKYFKTGKTVNVDLGDGTSTTAEVEENDDGTVVLSIDGDGVMKPGTVATVTVEHK